MNGLADVLGPAKIVAKVLLAGLAIMAGTSLWQAVATREAGDEALARSWADAARSFGSMLVAGLLLWWAGSWAVTWGLRTLAGLQSGR